MFKRKLPITFLIFALFYYKHGVENSILVLRKALCNLDSYSDLLIFKTMTSKYDGEYLKCFIAVPEDDKHFYGFCVNIRNMST